MSPSQSAFNSMYCGITTWWLLSPCLVSGRQQGDYVAHYTPLGFFFVFFLWITVEAALGQVMSMDEIKEGRRMLTASLSVSHSKHKKEPQKLCYFLHLHLAASTHASRTSSGVAQHSHTRAKWRRLCTQVNGYRCCGETWAERTPRWQ